jgi:hypothetical protein
LDTAPGCDSDLSFRLRNRVRADARETCEEDGSVLEERQCPCRRSLSTSMEASAAETDCDLAWTQLAQRLGVIEFKTL